MADFGNLYTFNSERGIVIKQTSDIESKVKSAFQDIFGASFSTEPATIGGRLIEAFTKYFIDTVGVNAQNARQFNIEQAVGTWLDNLGEIWGVTRGVDESDAEYRRSILASASRGSGFAASISNEIKAVSGVSKVVVLDNGNEDPAVLPNDSAGQTYSHSITVDPHSVFIAVLGGADSDIIAAIQRTKSAGCGYTKDVSYGYDPTTFHGFYRPTLLHVRISVTISGISYTGTDIVDSAKTAIKNLLDANSINSTVTKPMIMAALAGDGLGIVCTSVSITVSNDGTTFTNADEIVVPAYRYTAIDKSHITVNQ